MTTDAAELSIHFTGPFTLVGTDYPGLFASDIATQPGIYLWTVGYVGSGFLVSYVGENGTSFARRMKEHTIQTLGGNYRVSDPAALAESRDEVIWNGLWRRGTRDRLPEFIERFVDLAPVIQQQLRIVRILVAPLHTEQRLRRRVESALADHIWLQPPPAGALLPRDIRVNRRREGDALGADGRRARRRCLACRRSSTPDPVIITRPSTHHSEPEVQHLHLQPGARDSRCPATAVCSWTQRQRRPSSAPDILFPGAASMCSTGMLTGQVIAKVRLHC